MLFEVARARSQGRLLTKYQRDRAWVCGSLEIREQHDCELQRTVRVARLLEVDAVNQIDILPPLHDVQVVEARPHWWTITGFERVKDTVPDTTICYQQSWFLVPLRRDAPRTVEGAGVPDAP